MKPAKSSDRQSADEPAASFRPANMVGSCSASSRPTAYSKYIGRVGALAVALGVGGAIAIAPGVARADESSPAAGSDNSSTSARSAASSDDSSTSARSTASSDDSSASPPSEHSTDDESGASLSQPSAPSFSSRIVTIDESGVIVGSAGDAHTSDTDGNLPVPENLQDAVATPDLEQPVPEWNDVAIQPPPEAQIPIPSAAPTRTLDRAEKSSDTRQVAPPAAPTRAVAPAEKSFGKERIASQSVPARAVSTEVGDAGQPVTATAGQTHEWNDQSLEATFSAPTVYASSASELVDLIDDDLAPFDDPGPMGPVSSIMLAVQGWASRQFNQRFAKHTPVATVAETTQVEPLGHAQDPSVDAVSALAAIDPPVDVADQAGSVAQAAAVGAPTTTSVFFEASPRIGEANGIAMVPIVRTGDLNRVSTIEYGITPDTATAGVDYVGGTGIVTMEAWAWPECSSPCQSSTMTYQSRPRPLWSRSSTSTVGHCFSRGQRGLTYWMTKTRSVDPTSPPLSSDYVVTEQPVISGGLTQPLAFEFANHDPSLIYVAEKGGVIKVFDIDSGALYRRLSTSVRK